MKLKEYLSSQVLQLLLTLAMVIVVVFFLIMFQVPGPLIITIIIVMMGFEIMIFCYEYWRRKIFYNDLKKKIDELDKKCLITELLEKPNFIEGQIMCEALYEIDKSMYEEIELYQNNLKEFKEYIELWIHEVKLPIASSKLMIHNHEENERKLKDQISRIENYVEQVLYYARQESSEKDYLIKKCNIDDLVKNVIKKNQDSLLYQRISIEIKDIDKMVLSDSKWLEFIINQIVSNSIKYHGTSACKICFNTYYVGNNIALEIMDNGIGIKDSDLTHVFEQSFTGENGRIVSSSTGMGLYIVKKLCDKLGHQIQIASKQGEYTKVIIYFNNDQYYNVVR